MCCPKTRYKAGRRVSTFSRYLEMKPKYPGCCLHAPMTSFRAEICAGAMEPPLKPCNTKSSTAHHVMHSVGTVTFKSPATTGEPHSVGSGPVELSGTIVHVRGLQSCLERYYWVCVSDIVTAKQAIMVASWLNHGSITHVEDVTFVWNGSESPWL